jgi:two-component system OmpR family response regulator
LVGRGITDFGTSLRGEYVTERENDSASNNQGSLHARRLPSGPSILIINSNADRAELLASFLMSYGLVVDVVSSGADGVRASKAALYDAIIIDNHLPDGTCLAVLHTIVAASDYPRLMISAASSDEMDRISALELGADDYLVPECHPREVLARIRSLLRRRSAVVPRKTGLEELSPAKPEPASTIQLQRAYEFANFTLDIGSRRAFSKTGGSVGLSRTDVLVLIALHRARGSVISRQDLAQAAGTYDASKDIRAVDVLISRLRSKLRSIGISNAIETTSGAGYCVYLE